VLGDTTGERRSRSRASDFEIIPNEIQSNVPIPDLVIKSPQSPPAHTALPHEPFAHDNGANTRTGLANNAAVTTAAAAAAAAKSKNADYFKVQIPILPPPKLRTIENDSNILLDGPWGLQR